MSDKLYATLLSLLVLAPVAGIGGAIAGSQSQYHSLAKAEEVHKQARQQWLATCDKHYQGATCRLQELSDIATRFNRSSMK